MRVRQRRGNRVHRARVVERHTPGRRQSALVCIPGTKGDATDENSGQNCVCVASKKIDLSYQNSLQ